MVKCTDAVSSQMKQTKLATMVNGRTERCMDREFINGKMGVDTKVNTRTIRKRASVRICGLMVVSIMETGGMVSNMVRVLWSMQISR